MDQITINVELASKLAGIKKDDLIAQLQGENGEQKEDAGNILYNAVLKKFKDQEQELSGKYEDSFPRGVAKQSNAVYKELKAVFEQLGIEATSDNIIDGVRELSDKFPEVAKSGKQDLQTLTTDQIKKLPAYREIAKEHDSEKQQITSDWEQKFTDLQTNHKTQRVTAIAREKALSVLDSKNAAWGKDKAKQLDYFFKAIGTNNLDVDKDGNIFVTDENGAPLKDEARNLVTFENHIINNWQAAGYTFHEAPPGSGSAGGGRAGSGGSGSGGGSSISINSRKHYDELMNKAKTYEERSAIRTAWNEQRDKVTE